MEDTELKRNDTLEYNLESHSQTATFLDQINLLRAELSVIKLQNSTLLSERQKLEKALETYRNSPGIVGVVSEIIDNEKAIVRGYNGVVFYVKLPKTLIGQVNLEDRLVLAQSNLAIIDVLSKDKDYRATGLELVERPTISFNQIGGLQDVIREVEETVSLPLIKPELFKKFGVNSPKGILLYGPPGTGKTLLAKAVANASKATFISLSGSELIHKFIGEGAKVVKDLFVMAREKAPSIIFIDEIDAVAAFRLDSASGADREVHRTLMQLLVEMDGFKENEKIKIIAATNRIDILDEAILRPGRFDRVIEVPLPDNLARTEIFKIHTKNMPLAKDAKISELSRISENTSGADIEAICREAAIFAIRHSEKEVKLKYFIEAIDKVMKTDKKEEVINGKNMFR